MEAKVKFRNPGVTIHVNGQKIDQNNLTQEDYEYLIQWNKSYADYFVPLEEKIQPKEKPNKNGKAEESGQPN